MKVIWLIGFCAIAGCGARVLEEERVNGENGWYIPRIDGSFDWVDRDVAESYLDIMGKLEARSIFNAVEFYLYTRANPNEGQKIDTTKESIDASNFNAANPTKIIVHGWMGSKDHNVNSNIRDACLSSQDYNIIAIDWGRARAVDYVSSVLAAPGAGSRIADLVDYMAENCGLNLDTLAIIGYSLGAHVAGFAGKNIKSGRVHTIIALDAALPLFSYDAPTKRLSDNDAQYVESIQTNGGKLGFKKPIGKCAFYPNGGISQPDCGLDLTGICAHRRSLSYYIEAQYGNKFPSIKCNNYENAVDKNCGSSYSGVHMGSSRNAHMESGIYYVPVDNVTFRLNVSTSLQ